MNESQVRAAGSFGIGLALVSGFSFVITWLTHPLPDGEDFLLAKISRVYVPSDEGVEINPRSIH